MTSATTSAVPISGVSPGSDGLVSIRGVAVTANYAQGWFAAYSNVAYSTAQGKDVTSAQFLLGADDLHP